MLKGAPSTEGRNEDSVGCCSVTTEVCFRQTADLGQFIDFLWGIPLLLNGVTLLAKQLNGRKELVFICSACLVTPLLFETDTVAARAR